MTTRKVRLGVKTFLSFLTFVVCMCICSVPASAVLIMSLSATSMDIGDAPIIITINSDLEEEITWGVYLDPVSEYPTNAQLQNPAVLVAGKPARDKSPVVGKTHDAHGQKNKERNHSQSIGGDQAGSAGNDRKQ